MAVSGIANLPLGVLIQIMYTAGVRDQLSTASKEWEMIQKMKVGSPEGRQENFSLQGSYGPSAIQAVPVGVSSAAFPAGQKVDISEFTAVAKKVEATIEVSIEDYNRANMSKTLRYEDPVAVESRGKLIALKRYLSSMLHLDGTGVMGQVAASASPASIEGGQLRIQLSQVNDARGHIGALAIGEWLVLRKQDGTASDVDINGGTLPVYYKVTHRDFKNDTVKVQPLNSSFVGITVSSITTQPAADEVFYKFGQADTVGLGTAGIPDLTAIGSTDYNTLTEHMVGLDTLTQDDGRVIHGITMSDVYAGTRENANDETLDVTHLENGMNNVKNIVGEDAYSWSQGILDPYSYSRFIIDRENDRRFNTSTDSTRGTKKFSYIHRNDEIQLVSSEFAKKKRLYVLPEARQGQGKVLEYRCTDVNEVKAPGEKDGFRLKPSANGSFQKEMVQFLQMYMCLANKHPAAVLTVENFRS